MKRTFLRIAFYCGIVFATGMLLAPLAKADPPDFIPPGHQYGGNGGQGGNAAQQQGQQQGQLQLQGQQQGQLQGQGQAQSTDVNVGNGFGNFSPSSHSSAYSGSSSRSSSYSKSGAAAAAVSGGNVLQVNEAPIPTETTQNINYSGEYKLKNTPNVWAPNIYPSANCHGSTSGGVGVPGLGISIGTSWQDDDCGKRETARMFHQMGMNADAVAVLCSSPYAEAAPACKKADPQKTASRRSDAARDDDSRRPAQQTSSIESPDGRHWQQAANGDWVEVSY